MKKASPNLAVAETKRVKKSGVKAEVQRVHTHGLGVHRTDEAGVKRQISCFLFDDGGYGLHITTEAPGIEPTSTRICFSSEGFALLAEAVLHAQHHMHNYPIPKATGAAS
jgi:hypothetical protein